MCAQVVLPLDNGGDVCIAKRDWAAGVFTIALLGNGLAAYSVGPFPLPWIAQSLPLVYVPCLIIRNNRPLLVPGMGSLGLFTVWAAMVTFVQSQTYDYASLMPPLATTSYPVFLGLRFINLFAVAAQLYLTYYLLCNGYRHEVFKTLVTIGGIVALAAIYIYVAQVFTLWEPPRTRIGTQGEEQGTIFSYAFHRAMGTFREPSHLAEWMLVPFFVSLLQSQLRSFVWPMLMGSVILLTGSLTGILGGVLGFAIATLILNPIRLSTLKLTVALVIIAGISYVLFSVLVVSYSDTNTDLFSVIWDRVRPILEGGMDATNRDYIYEYFATEPIPPLGQGLGNAGLYFSNYYGTELVASFLSLYFNTLYSTGYVGLALLSVFLLRPILAIRRISRGQDIQRKQILLAAYCSWLVVFAVHAEELSIMFVTIFAVVLYEARPYFEMAHPRDESDVMCCD